MGVAKAALEATARYLARDLGPAPRAREPGVAPARWPRSPRAASRASATWPRPGRSRRRCRGTSRIRRPVAETINFLLSDAARAITAEIIHVDGGFHAMGTQITPVREEVEA